jgi:hypothetical protein
MPISANLAFETYGAAKSTIYYAKGDDIRNLELSILSVVTGIRNRDRTFAADKNAILTVKYTKDWRYTVLVSTVHCDSSFGDATVYEFSEKDLLKQVRDQEDSDDKVFVDVLLVWDSGNIKQCLQYVDTSGWFVTNAALKTLELLKNASKVFGFTVASNALVACVSYWFTGTPWYIVNAVLNSTRYGGDGG